MRSLPPRGNSWCWRPGGTQLPSCFSWPSGGDWAGLGSASGQGPEGTRTADRSRLALPSVVIATRRGPWGVSSCSQHRALWDRAQSSLIALRVFGRPNPAVLIFHVSSSVGASVWAKWGATVSVGTLALPCGRGYPEPAKPPEFPHLPANFGEQARKLPWKSLGCARTDSLQVWLMAPRPALTPHSTSP